MIAAQTWTIFMFVASLAGPEETRERERGDVSLSCCCCCCISDWGGRADFWSIIVCPRHTRNVWCKIFFKIKIRNIFEELFVFDEGGGGVPVTVVTPDPTTTNPGLYGGSARRPPLPPSAMDTLSSPWIVNNQSSQSVGTQDPSETTTGPLVWFELSYWKIHPALSTASSEDS